jgi:hypothetical protein
MNISDLVKDAHGNIGVVVFRHWEWSSDTMDWDVDVLFPDGVKTVHSWDLEEHNSEYRWQK